MTTSASAAGAIGVSAQQCICAKDSDGVATWNHLCPQHGIGPSEALALPCMCWPEGWSSACPQHGLNAHLRPSLSEVLDRQPRTVVPIEYAPSGTSVLRGVAFGLFISGVGVLALIGLVTVLSIAYASWHFNH